MKLIIKITGKIAKKQQQDLLCLSCENLLLFVSFIRALLQKWWHFCLYGTVDNIKVLMLWPGSLHLTWFLAKFYNKFHQRNKLDQTKYKNDSTESRCMLILKLPPFSPHCIAEWKSTPISKQTFIWTQSSSSCIILALAWHWLCRMVQTQPTVSLLSKIVQLSQDLYIIILNMCAFLLDLL